MQIELLRGNKFFDMRLIFKYDDKLVGQCRKLKEQLGWQNFSWNQESKAWVFKSDVYKNVLDSFRGVYISDDVLQYLTNLENRRKEETLKAEKAKITEIDIDLPLYPYQKIGVNFAVENKRVMINDEMGLGKSLQAIGAFHYLGFQQVLIICPNSLKSNWQREIFKWTKRKSRIVEDRFVPGINIINYEKLLKFKDPEAKKITISEYVKSFNWQMLIVDESHYIKESKSQRTKLVLSLCRDIEYVLLLTGTPMLNKPKELITQIKAVGHIDTFGDDWKFLFRYCNPKRNGFGWDFAGASNLEELNRKIQKFSIRRMKKEVLTDLPDKTINTTLLDLPEPKEYEKVENGVYTDLFNSNESIQAFYKSLAGKSSEEKARLILQRKMSKETQQMTSEILVQIEKLKQESARQKVIASENIFQEHIANKSKVIVFTLHKKTTYDLHRMYPQSVAITGDVKNEHRMAYIDQFQNDPETLFFFATMKTAGVGFNLTASSEVLFMELGWTPAEHKQCEDRAWRIGQKNNVNVNYLVMNNTIDMDIIDVLLNKSNVIEQSVGGELLSKLILKHSK